MCAVYPNGRAGEGEKSLLPYSNKVISFLAFPRVLVNVPAIAALDVTTRSAPKQVFHTVTKPVLAEVLVEAQQSNARIVDD